LLIFPYGKSIENNGSRLRIFGFAEEGREELLK